MASDFPRSPALLKGALVAFENQFMGIPNVIVFQYNPEQITRSLASRTEPPEASNVGAAKADTQRTQGPPVETINASISLDAADQLEVPQTSPHTVAFGLHPQLSALEMLMYPSSDQILVQSALATTGSMQVAASEAPTVLFIWGAMRVVPVRITSFSVAEEEFDPLLNPIRAKVDLGMRVISYMEFDKTSLGYYAAFSNQVAREVLAKLNLVNSAQQVAGMLPF